MSDRKARPLVDLRAALARAPSCAGDMLMATERTVWQFICAAIAAGGTSPTNGEITTGVGYSDTNTVSRAVGLLVIQGYVRRHGHGSWRVLVPLRRPISGAAEASTQGTEARQRKCLSCGHMFPSHGKGNRLCVTCKASAKMTYGMIEGGSLGTRCGWVPP